MIGSDGELLTLNEVAAYLKACKRTICRFAQNGDIPAFRLGGHLALSPFRVRALDRHQ